MSVEQTVENVRIRYDAVSLTRKHFWRLLGMILVVFLFTVLLETGLSFLGDQITKQETDAAIAAINAYVASPVITAVAPMYDAVVKLLISPRFLLFNLFYIMVTTIVSAGLNLGQQTQLLAASRGGTPRVMGGFCQMRYCFKAWRLALWILIKIICWALPGLACIIAGSDLSANNQSIQGTILIVAGVVLLFFLTIRAGMSYCLSTYILADKPSRSVRDCVARSKGLMLYRRWQGFKLGWPMILKMLGTFYAESMIFSLIATAIGDQPGAAVMIPAVLLMLLAITLSAIYFSLQFDLAYALFYLQRDGTATPSVNCVPIPTDLPEESPADSPEDTDPENTEEKENPNEEPVC